MKPPREPKEWKHPRWYCVFSDSADDCYYSMNRMRIIYPDGRSEWLSQAHYVDLLQPLRPYRPCWSAGTAFDPGDCGIYGLDSSPDEARKRMLAYSSAYSFDVVYMGEIK